MATIDAGIWQRTARKAIAALGLAALLVVGAMVTRAFAGPIPANPDCDPANAASLGLNVIMGTAANDVLTGTAGGDAIFGLGGDDQIVGGDGDDVLCGGDGDDFLLGGAGEDAIEGEAGNDTANGGANKDYVSGGDGNDTLLGGTERDKLRGEAGDDLLIGNLGNDLMFGGADNDELRGSAGNDFLHGGSGNDVLKGADGNDTLLGAGGDDELWGGRDNDTLFGMKGDDTLRGGEGDDRGFGGAGNDIILGNTGVDFANGGNGVDDCDAETEVNCNNPPVAVDDSVANVTGDYDTDEDTGFTAGNALDNDTDPNGDPLTVPAIDTTGTLGAVVNNTDGTFGYTPPASFNALAVGEAATDSWDYTAADPGGLTDTATVTVTVNGVNDAPTANPFTFDFPNHVATTVPDGPLDLLSNDTDPDTSDVLSVSQVQGAAGNVGVATATTQGGMVTVAADGSFTYDPTTSATLQALGVAATMDDTFTYQASDGNGGTSTATVTIAVFGVGGTIVVEKQTLPDGDPALFAFTGDAAGTIGDGSTITVADLSPGAYSSVETVPAGWALTDITCDDANSTGNVGTATATFNVEPGETVTCVFTNTKDGAIVVEKQTLPDGDPALFAFTGDAAGTISDGGTIAVGVAPGAYSSIETVPVGWALTDITCDDANSTGNVGTATASFNVEPGETVTCVFTNTKVNVPPVVTPSGGAAAFTEGGGAVTVDGTITVTDIDDTLLDKATVTITNLLDPTFETLAATASGGIAAGDITYSAPTLTIDPAVDQSLADFQAVLQSVTYNNTDQDPDVTPRVIRFVANDGTADSNNGDVTVNITAVNNAPSLTVPAAYDSLGNVGINVPAGSGLITAATITDPDFAGPFTVGGTVPTTTANSGAVSISPDGSFTYDPPAGFTGTDTFGYQVCDNGTPLPSQCSAAQTVTINVSDLIWFIDNSHGGSDEGTLANPFQTIGKFNDSLLTAPGHRVYLAETGTDYTKGIELMNNQVLIGEGTNDASTAAALGVTLPTHSNTLPGINGTSPVITTTDATGVTLASGNTIRGLNVGNTGLGTAFKDNGGTVGTLTISDVAVSGTGGITDIAFGGTLAVTFDSLESTSSPGTGIALNGVGGSFTVSGPGTDTSISNTLVGIGIGNSAGAATFDFGQTSISGDAGIDLNTNTSATFTFDSLSVTTTNGDGLKASNSGTINIGGTTNTINATTGAAVDASNVTFGNGSGGAATFQSLMSTSSPTDGIRLDSVAGSFEVTSATAPNATQSGIDISNSTGTFTFSGVDIDNSGTPGIRIDATTGDASFTGLTAVTNTTSNGIEIDGSAGTFTFSGGGLDIDTTSGIGFTASGGGTVNVTGTGNTIDTTTGTGININGTNIGASGVTFESIDVNGAPNGIVLDGTGTSGGFTITGDGGSSQNGSGGMIQSTTSDGISLNDTQDISIDQVALSGNGRHGVFGLGVTNFTMTNSTASNVGNANDENVFEFRAGTGSGLAAVSGTLTLNNVDVSDFHDTGLLVYNESGSLTIDIDNSDFDNNDDTNGVDAIFVETEGSASVSMTVDGGTFNDLEGDAVVVEAGSTGTNDVDITGILSTNGGGPDNAPNGGGLELRVDNGATLTFDVKGNTILDQPGDPLIISSATATGGGNLEGRVGGPNASDGNTFSGSGAGDGIDLLLEGPAAGGSRTFTILIQNNEIGVDNSGQPGGPFNGLGDDGIQIRHRDNSGTLNLTIEDNEIRNTGSEGIRIFADQDIAGPPAGPTTNLRIVDNVFSSIGVANTLELRTSDNAASCYHVAGNTVPGNINFSIAGASTAQITQSSLANLMAANGGAAVTGDTPTFNGPCTNPTLPAN